MKSRRTGRARASAILVATTLTCGLVMASSGAAAPLSGSGDNRSAKVAPSEVEGLADPPPSADLLEGFANVDSVAVSEFGQQVRALALKYPEAGGAAWFDEQTGDLVVRVKESPTAHDYRSAVASLPGSPVTLRFEETQYSLAQLLSLNETHEWAGEYQSAIVYVLANELYETVSVYVSANADEIQALAQEHAGFAAEVTVVGGEGILTYEDTRRNDWNDFDGLKVVFGEGSAAGEAMAQ